MAATRNPKPKAKATNVAATNPTNQAIPLSIPWQMAAIPWQIAATFTSVHMRISCKIVIDPEPR
jgi:hypothetical protein